MVGAFVMGKITAIAINHTIETQLGMCTHRPPPTVSNQRTGLYLPTGVARNPH
jgi:hypothetical protein